MDLNFGYDATKDKYVASAVVNKDYNVHLERTAPGSLVIEQRTAGTRGAAIFNEYVGTEYDDDWGASVYPKTITILSESLVTKGIITV